MQQIAPLLSGAQAVEGYYVTLKDPANAHWPVGILMQAIVNAQFTGGGERETALAANILKSLPLERREMFLAAYSVPSSILERIDNPGDWPVPMAIVWESDDVSSGYRERQLARAANVINTQSRRILRDDAFTVLSYVEKRREATEVLTTLAAENEINLDHYPQIAAEMEATGKDMVDAATGILEKAVQASAVTAQLSKYLQAFQTIARASDSYDQIGTAFRSMEIQAAELVDSLMPEPLADPENLVQTEDTESVEETTDET